MAVKAYCLFKAEKEGPFFVLPVQRLLLTVAKKMLLNRFELFFLQFVFEETKWHYANDCIRRHCARFRPHILISDSEAYSDSLKMVEIYVLYCAYFSKSSLNELGGENIFLSFAQ
jgi:hypothetical protein